MTQVITVLEDSAEKTVTRMVDDAKGREAVTITYKAGTPQFNSNLLLQRIAAALTVNAVFLASPAPTQAQVTAQVKALTKQVNALIRMQLNDLSDVSGT